MTRKIVCLVILTLLLTSILTSTISVQQANASYLDKTTTVSKFREKHFTLSFPIPQVVKIGRYDWLRIENCSYVTTPGQPILPVKSLVVKLPERSTVTNVSVEVKEALLRGAFSILPAPLPTIVGLQNLEEFSEDPTIYKDKSPFPKEWYVYREAHGMDAETATRVKYLDLNLFPLRFLPAENKVTRAEEISVTVTYSESPDILAPQIKLKNLIVTSPTLETYAVQLAQWKNTTGMSSRVLNTTWIYSHYSGVDNQEKIRNCIIDFVATYGIIYVTIFGDADQVPVRYAYVPDGVDTYTPTDLYYADLDGTWDDNGDRLYADQRYDHVDGIPDVYVGRIPPSLTTYAQVAVDKIKGYQQQFNNTQEWAQRIVLAAGTGHNGVENTLGNATTVLKQYIANIAIDKRIVKLYESAGNLSTATMASEINKGALFVNFAGHGDPGKWLFYWVIPGLIWNGYGVVDVQKLTNGFKLPVVTTMSCSTARFDDQDCIGEWFVLEPHGGSIAYFGATRIAWAYVDGWAPYGLMGEMDWRIYENFNEGYTKLGQMWGETVSEYVQTHILNYQYASKYDVKTLMEFVLLGDPTVGIWPALFEDDFESGNFGAWSGTSVSYGESASVTNTLAHHGIYSGKFTSNGGASNEYAYCYKNIMPLSELYVRGNFYVATYGIAEDNDRFFFIVFKAGTEKVAFAGWRRTAGVITWSLIIRHGSGWVKASSVASPLTNQWYCVELHWKKDALAGLGELWIDGTLVCSITGKNTAYFGEVNRVDFGLAEVMYCGSTTVYGDCAKMANTYIGPEGPPPPPPPSGFEDGFEFGGFSAWTGTSTSAGETATVINTLAHHGVYSAMFTSNGGSGSEMAYCYRTIPSASELYARGYFRIAASGIADESDRFYFIVFKAGTEKVAFAGWRRTGGVVTWSLIIRDGTGWLKASSAGSPSLSQWYCVELHWKKDATAGLGELYVNGVLACSITGKNTGYYGDVNRVDFGLAEVMYCGATTTYGDCCVISNAYIGPEGAPPPIFEDGFESGSFSAWDSTSVSLGETAIVTNALAHHGAYSAMFTSNGNGGAEMAYCYKTVSSGTELYARGYFYVSFSGIVDEADRFFFIVFKAGTEKVAFAGWRKTAGVVTWCLIIRHGSGWVKATSAVSPSLNQWYRVELHWRKDAVNGLGELWVDGVLACSIAGKNTAYFGNVYRVDFGLAELVYCSGTVIYADCTAISATYIGPEILDVWFSSVDYYGPDDPDGDGYFTTIQAVLNIDTSDETCTISVLAYLVDPFGERIAVQGNSWTITSTNVEYGIIYFDAAASIDWPDPWVDCELFLFDELGNLRDYRYYEDAWELNLYE